MSASYGSRKSHFFRKKRVRARISGSPDCPRFSVFRSLRSISVQAIDDVSGKTLVSVYLRELPKKDRLNTVSGAFGVGKILAEKCLASGISSGVFDRNGYRYHGRVKAVADGAREGGLSI